MARARACDDEDEVCGMSTRHGARLDKLAALNLMSFIPAHGGISLPPRPLFLSLSLSLSLVALATMRERARVSHARETSLPATKSISCFPTAACGYI
jgi:hypothetical protein